MQINEKYFLNLIKFIVLAAFSVLLISCENTRLLEVPVSPTATITPQFDGDRAFQHIVTQLDFGERTPGSIGHDKAVDWMVDELTSSKWDVSIQELPYGEYVIRNVVAKRGSGEPWIVLGAHYDTRFFADQDMDPEMRLQSVPGANDGASGVAVLLELARVLPADLPGDIWLVFFDAADNGDIPGWDWILGSQAFVDVLEGIPDAVVVIDMIGDKDLEIFWERNSDFELTREIWQVATDLGYGDYFISQPGYRIIDDHLPFVRGGIPAVDIIDFDYPAWHTVDDTIDNVSARSLQVVGDVLYHWLLTRVTNNSVP
jgi:glutaminyl-peptide cyclotransferase